MPVDLSVKKVPDELAQKLRERAEANHRSLQRELLVILQGAVENMPYVPLPSGAGVVREKGAKYLIRHRRVIPARSESALIIRRFRDGRTLTARELYDEVIALGGPSPDDAAKLIRRGRLRR